MLTPNQWNPRNRLGQLDADLPDVRLKCCTLHTKQLPRCAIRVLLLGRLLVNSLQSRTT